MRNIWIRWRAVLRIAPVKDTTSISTVLTTQEFDQALGSLRGERPDSEEYQRLSSITLHVAEADALARLDPFSESYRAGVLDLYLLLRGQGGNYQAERDEASETMPITNPFTDMAPWNFSDVRLTSEFLHAWGQILRFLDIAPSQRPRVLEYGCASGQFLLMLARMGIDAFGVDIDERMLDLLRAQAEATGVQVPAEQAEFGEGFGEERFDRIIFFESFHHALDTPKLLHRLRRRLKPGGRLVLCGEPIMSSPNQILPYPWGPRLDGLSVYCIRQYGWMELGFTRDFLGEAMQRAGWTMQEHDFSGIARAQVFVATPVVYERQAPVTTLGPDAAECDWLEGWFPSEPSQRWTQGGVARLRLPAASTGSDIALLVSNHLPVVREVTVSCGRRRVTVSLGPAERSREIFLPHAEEQLLSISCAGKRPLDLIPGNDDPRDLGIAVQSITIEPPEIFSSAVR